MKKPILYLANAYGFTPTTAILLEPFIRTLSDMGYEVWEPFARHGDGFVDPYQLARDNANDLEAADIIFAILNGEPPDTGVMFELGYAFARNKPRVLFRDDIRTASDSHELPVNLMVAAGHDSVSFNASFYKDMDDLLNPQKTLMLFLSHC